MDWYSETGYDWAVKANDLLKSLVVSEDNQKLIQYEKLGKEMQLAAPTPEHYLPLIYSLALKEENDKISFFNDKIVNGSLSMTSILIQ